VARVPVSLRGSNILIAILLIIVIVVFLIRKCIVILVVVVVMFIVLSITDHLAEAIVLELWILRVVFIFATIHVDSHMGQRPSRQLSMRILGG